MLCLLAASLVGCATTSQKLAGTRWQLDDLSGVAPQRDTGITLEFEDSTRVIGNASCNSYFGPVRIQGQTIDFGQLGSTRKQCPERIMVQERDYMEALEDATRYSISGPFLTIYVMGRSLPLRFSRISG
jgi:heat shock protein HslJ